MRLHTVVLERTDSKSLLSAMALAPVLRRVDMVTERAFDPYVALLRQLLRVKPLLHASLKCDRCGSSMISDQIPGFLDEHAAET